MQIFLYLQYVKPKLTHEIEYHILTKFHTDCVKIVDFLIKAYFWVSVNFGLTYCINITCKAIFLRHNEQFEAPKKIIPESNSFSRIHV